MDGPRPHTEYCIRNFSFDTPLRQKNMLAEKMKVPFSPPFRLIMLGKVPAACIHHGLPLFRTMESDAGFGKMTLKTVPVKAGHKRINDFLLCFLPYPLLIKLKEQDIPEIVIIIPSMQTNTHETPLPANNAKMLPSHCFQ